MQLQFDLNTPARPVFAVVDSTLTFKSKTLSIAWKTPEAG
jgi:hypothetical protein